jgi:hypothetical protein
MMLPCEEEQWQTEERVERWLACACIVGLLCACGLIVWGFVSLAQWVMAP